MRRVKGIGRPKEKLSEDKTKEKSAYAKDNKAVKLTLKTGDLIRKNK